MPRPRTNSLHYVNGGPVRQSPTGKRVVVKSTHAPGNEGLVAYHVKDRTGTIRATRRTGAIIEVHLDGDPTDTTWYFPSSDVRVLPA